MIYNLLKKIKCKLYNKSGLTLLELLIVLALMSVVVIPAYMLIVNGSRIFARETDYQAIFRDTHAFFEYVNTDVRINGFNNATVLKEDEYPSELINQLTSVYGETALMVKRKNSDVYYIRDNDDKLAVFDINKDGNIISRDIVNSISKFDVVETKSDDEVNMITLSVTIAYDGKEDIVSTNIYKRYEEVAGK